MELQSAIVLGPKRLFRESISQTLRKSGLKVIAEGRDLNEVLNCAPDSKPTLIISHYILGKPQDITDVARETRAHFPDTKLVLLCDEWPAHLGLIRADVSAFLFTDITCALLRRSLELVLLGHQVFPERLRQMGAALEEPNLPLTSSAVAPPVQPFESVAHTNSILSAREQQIVRFLAGGLPNKAIARKLNISEATVKVHVKAVLRKTHARNRTEAAVWGVSHYGCASLGRDLTATGKVPRLPVQEL